MAFVGEASCPPDAPRARGFKAVSQKGFFSARPQAGAPYPNAPILRVALGDTHVWAQFDTGYDGLADRASVDINQALYDRLVERGVNLRPLGDVVISTCAGQEARHVYEAPDLKLIVEDDSGAPILAVGSYRLLLKPRNACGGIANWDVPAAQLDASFLRALGEVVFDPFAETVWIKGP